MKKATMLMVLMALCLLLSGCTASQKSDVPMTCEGIAQTAQEAAPFAELTEANVNYLEKYLMIDAEDLNGWVLRRDASRVTPEMILVLQVKDGADQAAIMQAVKDYHEEQLLTYRDYQPDQVFKLEDAKVMKNGAFIVLIVSPDASKSNAALGGGWQE